MGGSGVKKQKAADTPARRLQGRRRKQLIAACAAVAAVVAVAVILAVVFAGGKNAQGNEGQSEGFPYSVNANLVSDMRMLGPDVLLLTDESVTVLDSSGKEISRLPHTYKRPAMDLCAGRALVYDRGGRRLHVQNRRKILLEKELETDIITCTIGRSGNFAVATRADNAAGLLTVYDKNVKEVFKWRSSKDYIMNIALSDDGKYAAAAVTGSSSGERYSRVYVFDLSEEEPLAEFSYPGAALFDLSFSGNSTVLFTGDTLRGVIENHTESVPAVEFGTGELSCYDTSEDGLNALVLSEYGSMNANDLVVYDGAGQESFRQAFSQEVRWVSTDGENTAVLLAGSVQVFDKKGRQIGHFAVRSDALRVLVSGRDTYVLSMGELDRLSTRDQSLNSAS